jgi:hypothetical protein
VNPCPAPVIRRGDSMNETKETLKAKVYRGMRQYLFISLYLWVVFALFALYESIILAQRGIPYEPQGLAIINALAMGKIVLFAQELHLAEQFRHAPLIYPTVFKSAVFALILGCFKILEAGVVGMIHGKPFLVALGEVGGGTLLGIISVVVILFVLLIPFFAFGEMSRYLGEDKLRELLFKTRGELPRPSQGG